MRYPDNAPTTKVDESTYSYLSPKQLKELRRCLWIAYPHYTAANHKLAYVNLACQPEAAKRFMAHREFRRY